MDNFAPDAPRIFSRPARRAAPALLAALLLAGCGADGGGDRPTYPTNGKEVSTRPTWTTSSSSDPVRDPGNPAKAGGEARSDRTTWAILLGAFAGKGSDQQAATLAALASQQGGLTGAFVERKGDGFAALYGAYDDPGSPQARKDLAAARAIQIGGARPFESAILAGPAVRGVAGATPEFDLRNVRQFHGEKKAKVTLQIGIYGRTDGRQAPPAEVAEYRKAAEEAVRVLRDQGELAFYYHTAERSTVTVGLFSDERDPAIAEFQKRFPFNMLNGQTTTNAKAGAGSKGQPSFTVGLPKGD